MVFADHPFFRGNYLSEIAVGNCDSYSAFFDVLANANAVRVLVVMCNVANGIVDGDPVSPVNIEWLAQQTGLSVAEVNQVLPRLFSAGLLDKKRYPWWYIESIVLNTKALPGLLMIFAAAHSMSEEMPQGVYGRSTIKNP